MSDSRLHSDGPRRFRRGCGGIGARALAVLFASLFFRVAAAEAQLADAASSEPGGDVQIVAVRTSPRTATVYAQLTNCTEVTLTLTLVLSNAVVSGANPLTVDSAGRTYFELISISQDDPRRGWGYSGGYGWQYGRRGEAPAGAPAYDLPYKHGPFLVTQAERGETHAAGTGAEYAIDWGMPAGTVICAAREGTVVALRKESTVGVKDRKFASFGNFVIVRHDDGTFGEYGHMKRKGVLVWLGQRVERGAVIGFSGDTGYTSGPHLHFGVFQNIDAQTRRSIPVQFRTRSGSEEALKAGQAY